MMLVLARDSRSNVFLRREVDTVEEAETVAALWIAWMGPLFVVEITNAAGWSRSLTSEEAG